MRWTFNPGEDFDSKGWIEAETPVGEWAICGGAGGLFNVVWYPAWAECTQVFIGNYRTESAAKGAAKRYAKKMAAGFKTMAKAGWQ